VTHESPRALNADDRFAVVRVDDLLDLMVNLAEDLPYLRCPLAHPLVAVVFVRDGKLRRVP
jgi:hypothetical protein